MNAQKTALDKRKAVAGFLARFAHNKAGNTLAMMAMALIPLIGITGSAIDLSRTYMVKTRLQQACDAGVLAGRKSMAGSTYGTTEQNQAQNIFKANMRNGLIGSADNWVSSANSVTFTSSQGANQEILGSAVATVPLTLINSFFAILNKPVAPMNLAVDCSARLDISNTDVVMVLDVTGSMERCINESTNSEDAIGSNGCTTSNNKISGLRGAVEDFYSTVQGATGSNSRFRLGFVPYSSTVNMGTGSGALLPSGWVVSTWTYQSRVANMTTPGWTANTSPAGWNTQTFGSAMSNAKCNSYGNNSAFSSPNYSPANTNDASTNNSNPNNVQAPALVYQSSPPPTDIRRVYERLSLTWSSGSQTCQRRWRVVTTTYSSSGRFGFTNWTYQPVAVNVSTYAAGTPVNVYTANVAPAGSVTVPKAYDMVELVNSPNSNVTGTSTSFDGCYEERNTTANTTTDFSPIPADAFDLDHATMPTNVLTQWRPMWPELIYSRTGATETTSDDRSPVSGPFAACPSVASKLATRTATQVSDYVDGITPVGGTYHDLGMAWGLRMISANGIWGSENTTAPNGNPISRHIIFLTDGSMCPSAGIYGSHGYEDLDNRTAPAGTQVRGTGASPDCVNPGTGDSVLARHNARFLALCDAARADGISVWTIAFVPGNQVPATLTTCADPNQAFTATNSATLRTQFQAIASRIAQLRLSQ